MINVKKARILTTILILAILQFVLANSTISYAATVQQNLQPITDIDVPTSTVSYNSTSILVAGWAINSSGIKSVQIYCDNILEGQASTGQSRPDVQNVYKNYTGAGTSGYRYILDGSKLLSGNHTIKVVSTGNNGSTSTQVKQFSVGVLIYNVDTPIQNQTYSLNTNSITVRGWAIDPSGISQVQVYVDGNLVQNASIGQSRTDVAQVFPGYKNSATSGLSTSLNISSLSNGTHKITLKFIGVNGDTVSKDVSINKGVLSSLPAITDIDTPTGTVNSSSTTVVGWALNPSGVKEVDVLVDNNKVGTATLGDTRADVAEAYPQYLNSTSGYHYTLNLSALCGGSHTLTVQAIGNNGAVSSSSTSIARPDSILTVDSPQIWQNIKSSINVSGWSLDITGIKEVDVLVDGTHVGTATLGIARPDVANLYPYYNSQNSGFNYNLDISKLTNGTHTITINSIGNGGQVVTKSVSVFVGNITIYKGADVFEDDDISNYQELKADGVQVVIQKATQGLDYTDSLLQYRSTTLTQDGFKVGYYHFADNDNQPDAQAQHFLDEVKGLHSDTVLWLDIEDETVWNKQQAVAFTEEFIKYVQSKGYKIGIYSGTDFYNDYLSDSNFNVPIWLANYGAQPSQYPNFSWQYTDTGTLNGVTGAIDLDYFNNSIFVN
jgi:GH25 family lysozyme M1 (1,4-beta-N-acetylmuramidase)